MWEKQKALGMPASLIIIIEKKKLSLKHSRQIEFVR